MTQTEQATTPTPAPPVGTEIELDGRRWTVATPDDAWVEWYIAHQRLASPVYLVGDEGEWTVESAAYVTEYGAVRA